MSRPLRILTLATLFPAPPRPNFGIFVGRQTAGLNERPDVDVTVINPIGMPPFPLSLLAGHKALRKVSSKGRWSGLSVHRPRFRSLPRLPQRNARAIADAVYPLAEKLHREEPLDLIDAEFFWPDGPAAMMLAERLGLPFTIKARGFDITTWAHDRRTAPLILKAAERAAALLTVSEALKMDMIALGMNGDAIRVHYTGIDRQMFHPLDRAKVKKQLGISGPLISCVGALIPRKRQALLIDALPLVPKATLVLIGQGPDEKMLRSHAETAGVADRVRFTGSLSHAAIARYVGASDIMALVSRSEGLANAWVEALAAGTPVIACDVGGAKELVRGEAAGRIVEPDAAAIAHAANMLIANPPPQSDVRRRTAHMGWDRNAMELEAIFRTIVGKDDAG